jgi:tetratricopeptide (TPR) repeat protein/transcriptional regulator with XRE-family HTH domain
VTTDAESSLAELLRTWRERALLTQEQLARRTGLGVRTIRRLESDSLRRPRKDSMRLLADALELTGTERAQLIAAARGGPAEPGRPRLKQLPADVAGFTGRTRQLKEMDGLLAGYGTATTMVISAIAGTAGVGKTALALHWAHRVADRFPDGQLYVNLRGYDPSGAPVEPGTAIRGFLEALEVPPPRIPAEPGAQSAMFRSLVADKRLLVVLDNARDAEQVRPLLPGGPRCVTVVTSRDKLTGLVATEGAQPFVLDQLSTVEAKDLLTRRVGTDRAAAEPEAVDEIIGRCERLPLALAVVAARAATESAPLATFAAELREAGQRLDPFATGDAASDLRAVFSWSYQGLGAPAARLFRLLGLHPGPDASAAAAASLAGLPPRQAARLLDELTRAHLVTEHRPRRYAGHDLLRAFAREQAEAVGAGTEAAGAVHRVLEHYLHTAYAAALQLHPLRKRFELPPPLTGVTPETFGTDEDARGWFAAEHAVLLAAVDLAAAAGHDLLCYRLAWCLTDYLDWRGHWQEWAAVQQIGLRAAERLGDPTGQALAHRGIAGASARRGDYDTAAGHLLRALDIVGEHGTAADQAQVRANLGTVYLRQGRYDDALRHELRALDLCREAGDRVGEADELGSVGWAYARSGQYPLAVRYGREALALQRELGNREGQAAVLDSLGYALHHVGEYSEAASCFEQAIELCRLLANRYYEAFSLDHLGDTRFAAGDPGAARAAWQQAARILDELGHPDVEQVKAKLASG